MIDVALMRRGVTRDFIPPVRAATILSNDSWLRLDTLRVDAALGDHARILDMSIAGMSAREIGIQLGFGGD
jgi:hypothetical protein